MSYVISRSTLGADSDSQFIGNHINTVSGYVSESMNRAAELIDSLQSFSAPSISSFSSNQDISQTDFNSNVDDFTSSLDVTAPIFNSSQHLPVDIPNVDTDLGTIDINDSLEAPKDFYTPIQVQIPNQPVKPNLTAPIAPFIDYSSTTYSSPEITTPNTPELTQIILPDAPEVNIIEFEDLYPHGVPLFNATVPDGAFTYDEREFTDDLLEKIKDVLIKRLDGGTGLNPIVEKAIWDRGRDRESKVFLSSERALLVERGAMGFSRPTGSLMAAMDDLFAELQSKTIELSREIMIKQAEMEQSNLKDAIAQTISLEDALIKQYMAINQRLFEAAKYTRDMFFEIFKAKISQYNTQVEAYKAFIQIYQARLQAESTKIELFKAEVSAKGLLLDFDKNKVGLFEALNNFQRIKVDLFKELYAAEANRIKIEEMKIDLFKSQVDGYSKGIESYSADIQAFSEVIKAQGAKLGVNETQAKIFATRMQSYATQSEANSKRIQLKTSIQELELKKRLAILESHLKQSQVVQTNAQIELDAFRAQNETFNAQVNLARSKADVKATNQRIKLEARKMAADVALANAKLLADTNIASTNAAIEATKGAGQIASNLSASALSALNVSSSFGSSVSLQASDSHSFE